MLYQSNRDLPSNVRDRLPEAAQERYRIAFNSALQWYEEEHKAHQTAWTVVRSQTSTNSSYSG